MELHGFSICNNNITREVTKSTIDHLGSKIADRFNHHTDTVINDFSDHNSVITEIHMCVIREKYITTQKVDIVSLNQKLMESFADEIGRHTDANNCYNFISNTLLRCLSESTTTTTKKIKTNGKHCPWMEEYPNLKILIEKIQKKAERTRVDRQA